MFKDTCVVVNHYIDENNNDCYQETTLSGVCWQSTQAIQAESGGYGNNSTILVVIPCNVGADGHYVSVAEFSTLTDKAGYWTLQEGDRIHHNSEEATITGISRYAHGAMAHFEITGV